MSAWSVMALANDGPLPIIMMEFPSFLPIGVTREGCGLSAIFTVDFNVADRLESTLDMLSAFMRVIIFTKLLKKPGIAGRFS